MCFIIPVTITMHIFPLRILNKYQTETTDPSDVSEQVDYHVLNIFQNISLFGACLKGFAAEFKIEAKHEEVNTFYENMDKKEN